MCPAIVIFMPLKLPICNALLCTIVFTPPSPFNSPFTAAFASTPGIWQRKTKQGSGVAHNVNKIFPLHPMGWRHWLWEEDLLAVMRAAFICPASQRVFPTRRIAAVCHDPRAKSSTVVQTQYSYHAGWKWAQVKIPASNSSELWRDVLTLDEELISKIFFPECIYPLLIARVPGPLAVIKKAIPAKSWSGWCECWNWVFHYPSNKSTGTVFAEGQSL